MIDSTTAQELGLKNSLADHLLKRVVRFVAPIIEVIEQHVLTVGCLVFMLIGLAGITTTPLHFRTGDTYASLEVPPLLGFFFATIGLIVLAKIAILTIKGIMVSFKTKSETVG